MSEELIVNETGREESFAELLDKSGDLTGWLSPGQRVKVKVVGVSGDTVYVHLGGKTEGVIDIREFTAEDGELTVKTGDEVEASFVSVEDGVRKLTTRLRGFSAAKASAIKGAYEAGVAVEGEVKREVKGGYEVLVGEARCFCPRSQMDIKIRRDEKAYVGETHSFKVIEFKEEGRNIVISRRALLEEEKKARLEKLKETLTVGMEVSGTVKAVQNFGAFVDVGGFDGLIPASEMSWIKSDRPADVLAPGAEVTAKIIGLDWEKERVTLSLKALKPDPWAGVADRYKQGGKVEGAVVRLAPFGAFVSLEPGVDGLVHISNLGSGRKINHPKEVLETGQWVEAYVLAVDPVLRKISLSLKPEKKVDEAALPKEGEILEGEVEGVMPFGVFLKLESGFTGLIPNSEMGTPRGTDHNKSFPRGTKITVLVRETDKKKGKVVLSRKGVVEKAEEDEFKEYRQAVKKETSSGMGSLGEKLKAVLEGKALA